MKIRLFFVLFIGICCTSKSKQGTPLDITLDNLKKLAFEIRSYKGVLRGDFKLYDKFLNLSERYCNYTCPTREMRWNWDGKDSSGQYKFRYKNYIVKRDERLEKFHKTTMNLIHSSQKALDDFKPYHSFLYKVFNVWEFLKKSVRRSSNFVNNHKWKIIGGITISSFLFVWYKLKKMRHKFNNRCVWSVWNAEVPNLAIELYPEEKIVKELYLDIGKHFCTSDESGTLVNLDVDLLFRFMQEAEKEETFLNKYIYLLRSIKKFGFSLLFSSYCTDLQEAEKRLKRIQFLKSIV